MQIVDSAGPIHVLGAGPAGLAAAYTLAKNRRRVLVSERARVPGGISGSFKYKGFILDYGPHFMSREAARGAALWEELLGVDQVPLTGKIGMLWRGKVLRYPPDPLEVLRSVGPLESAEIIASFAQAKLRAHSQPANYAERTCAEFGEHLFEIILRPQVEKLWGVKCEQISPAWQPGRVRRMSLLSVLGKTLLHHGDLGWLRHPRLGCGQTYEKISTFLSGVGQPVRYQRELMRIEHDGRRIRTLVFKDLETGGEERAEPDQVLSSLPLSILVRRMSPAVPAPVMEALGRLRFRSTILVYFIVDEPDVFPQQCIYINDRALGLGRVTNYGNWSPAMRANDKETAISCEYWANFDDEVWKRTDEEHIARARSELDRTGIVNARRISDAFVRRVPSSHPVFSHEVMPALSVINTYLARFENLRTMGRAGAFRYEDQDGVLAQGIDAAEEFLAPSQKVARVG